MELMPKWWYHYMIHYDDNLMNNKLKQKTKKMKKETRGRKALPEKEKKKAIFIMVKNKHVKEVQHKLKQLEREYSTK